MESNAYQQEEGAKRRYQYCTDISGTIFISGALQGHSGRNLIDPSLQDNLIIQRGFFQQIYHEGCAFNLHSIINNGLIPGRSKFKQKDRQYSFCPLIPEIKAIKILQRLTSINHVEHKYMHSAWKKHQDPVFWVDINLAIQKGLTFYQPRSNAVIFQGTLPA